MIDNNLVTLFTSANLNHFVFGGKDILYANTAIVSSFCYLCGSHNLSSDK